MSLTETPRARTQFEAGGDDGEKTETNVRRPRVVIVGGGFAGLMAAKRLRSAPVDVTLIDRQNHHLFQPLLYQVATATLSPADISVPLRATLRAAGPSALTVVLDEVTGVDRTARTVATASGRAFPFDYLLIATGARYHYFGHDDWPAVAPGLKSLRDAVGIRQHILGAFEQAETEDDPALRRRHLTFVIIGGGPTGIEMAGALAELTRASLAHDFASIDPSSARIVLVEAGQEILAAFSPKLRAYARRKLEQLGVEVILGRPVEAIEEGRVIAGGQPIEASTILWCAGVRANPAAAWLGVEADRGGRVPVRPDLSVAGDPAIFVAGDGAVLNGADGQPLPALAPVAKQQGHHVGDVIARRVEGREPPPAFRYRDWGSMATIGRGAAVGKFGRLEISGRFAWVVWGIVHVFYLIGFRNRLAVLVNWMWAIVRFEKSARIIIGPKSQGGPPGDGRS